ncbi:hypothetical protein RRG08_047686 [Elysia crispata]|uniref:Uncharacterized protein n=1 Tax=Elysia crispata TaxID=231223 RepID=A0AAE1BCE1_9GAST|nr:hypothetical protein RRG08_047686 [Elysia crispata]
MRNESDRHTLQRGAMSTRATSFRLLPMLLAAALFLLLSCQLSMAQEDEDTTTDPTTSTTETGIKNNKTFGRGNIIIGGAFGLEQERAKRRASRRRDDDQAPAASYSLGDLISGASGRRRKNRRRGKKEDDDLDTAELTNNIEVLAEANKDMMDRATQEQQRRENGRRRGVAKRYFGGVGREFIGFPNRARETINDAVTDMLGGVNTVLRMIPYDEIEGTALRVASYLQELAESGVPAAVLDSLMSSRVGGARETMEALVELQGSPEQLEPILEDIASNYRNLFKGAAGQVDDFLSLILPRRQQASASVPVLEQLPPIDVSASTGASDGFAPPEIAGDSTPPPFLNDAMAMADDASIEQE